MSSNQHDKLGLTPEQIEALENPEKRKQGDTRELTPEQRRAVEKRKQVTAPTVSSFQHPDQTWKKIQGREGPSPFDKLLEHKGAMLEEDVCCKCRHFVDKKQGQEELKRDQFWERVFNNHGDGTDFKLKHIGDPRAYSICRLKGCATHELGMDCKEFEQ